MADSELQILISAVDDASAVLRSVQQQIGGMNNATRTAGQGMMEMGDRLVQVGQGFDQSFSQPARQAFMSSLNAAGNFEASMNRVSALTGESGENFDAMRAQAMDLGSTTQYSASQSAEAMGFLAMAGFDANEIMAAMPGTLSLAAAGQVDLGRAADIASNVLSGYSTIADESGGTAEGLARANDVMAKAMTSSNVNLNSLASSMQYVAPVAAGMGFEFEEVTAAIGFLGDAGMQGSQAGTILRSVMGDLSSPSGRVSDALNRLGVEVEDSSGELLSLTEILGNLEDAGATSADMMELFGKEAGPGMINLLSRGSEELAAFTDELRVAGQEGGVAADIAGTQMQGFNGAIITMQSALEGLAIAIMDGGLLNALAGLVGGFTRFVSFLSKMPTPILAFGALLLGLVGIIGPVIIAVGALVGAVGGITAAFAAGGAIAGFGAAIAGGFAVAAAAAGPILLAIGLIAAGAALIYQNWASIASFFSGFFEGLMAGLQPAIFGLQVGLATVGEALAPIVQWIGSLFESSNQAATGINTLGMAFGLMAGAAISALVSLPMNIALIFQSVMAIVSNLVTQVRMFFVNLGLDIQIAFMSAMQSIQGAIAGIGAMIAGTFAGIVATVMGAIATVISGITGGAAQAVAAVVSMGASMLAAIQGIAAQMFAAGAQIVSSIAQGIMSGIGQVTSAISSVAATVRGALPFSPPEYGPLSDIMSVGGNIVGSIAQGIVPGPITGAMQSALAPAASAMGVGGGIQAPVGGGAAPSGGGSTTINLTVNAGGDGDPQSIVATLRAELPRLMAEIERNKARVSYG